MAIDFRRRSGETGGQRAQKVGATRGSAGGVGCGAEASCGAHRPKQVTPHARLTWTKVMKLQAIDLQKWLLRIHAFHAPKLNFMRAEYMIDVLREKVVFRLEFWPAYLLY